MLVGQRFKGRAGAVLLWLGQLDLGVLVGGVANRLGRTVAEIQDAGLERWLTEIIGAAVRTRSAQASIRSRSPNRPEPSRLRAADLAV